MTIHAFHECQACFEIEERVFEDTFTGTKLCLRCLGDIAPYLTNSPYTEADNLDDFVKAAPVRAGRTASERTGIPIVKAAPLTQSGR